MNIEDYIKILDDLASGIDPITKEIIPNESILKKRQVIRALQFAIDSINENINYVNTQKYEISLNEDKEYILEKENLIKIFEQFNKLNINSNITSITRFLLGYDNIDKSLFTLEDYGILKNVLNKKKLQRYISQFIKNNHELVEKYSISNEKEWKNININDYPLYNKMKPEYIVMFKDKVKELPIKITEEKLKNNPHAIVLRQTYPRAYESYSQEELLLLNKAFKYTNNIEILCDIFQRNENTLESHLKKFYFERKKERNN